jgi:hypothetical protein
MANAGPQGASEMVTLMPYSALEKSLHVDVPLVEALQNTEPRAVSAERAEGLPTWCSATCCPMRWRRRW